MFSNNIRPDGIHYGVFLPTIHRQMSDEQLKKWLPLAQNYRVIGTYAQTELGHGEYRYALCMVLCLHVCLNYIKIL